MPYTKQQVFNDVWQWFVVEKHGQSIDEKGCCKYRGPNGTRCAAGVCLPDDLYRPSWDDREGINVLVLTQNNPALEKIWPNDVLSLLRQCQCAHDEAAKIARDSVESFESLIEVNLRRLAGKFDLHIPGESG